MNIDQKRKLENHIKIAVASYNKYLKAHDLINEMCEEIYDTTPADIDADTIIDSIFGGCGLCSFITANEFDQIMKQSIIRMKGNIK